MCGVLFVAQRDPSWLDANTVEQALARQHWRGPDARQLRAFDDGRVFMGHNRLAIIDPQPRSDQPMRSRSGRFCIVFNGEIYNFRDLRRRHGLATATESDTETLLAGYELHGERFFDELEGMYAFVIYDTTARTWIAVRDPLGIKPLYFHTGARGTIFASEPAVVAALCRAAVDEQSIREWRLIRRPVPGASFFTGVHELLPGHLHRSDGSERTLWVPAQRTARFDADEFEALLRTVVRDHEVSDVDNTALLSGGIDSAAILALSRTAHAYSVGLEGANEFEGATETAHALDRSLSTVTLGAAQMAQRWHDLARLRGEPLAVPNEALIHAGCSAMRAHEKVVLTGEGADELLFGYDRLFRWALTAPRFESAAFLARYGYDLEAAPTARLHDCLDALAAGARRAIDVVEDFFYRVHLPGLLRRMDFASMAASKEARVPFADRRLVDYCYRLPAADKLDAQESKKPLRALLRRLGLTGPLARPKIGFSAQPVPGASRHDEYRAFQALNLEALSWS